MATVPIASSGVLLPTDNADRSQDRPSSQPLPQFPDRVGESKTEYYTEDESSGAESDEDEDDSTARGRRRTPRRTHRHGRKRGRKRGRLRTPPRLRKRRDAFRKRVETEKFWDVRDTHMQLTPMSMYFLEECARTSTLIDDARHFVLPSVSEEDFDSVPTIDAAKRTRLQVKLKDKLFFVALQEVQGLLKERYDIEWLTLPFSVSEQQENEVYPEEAAKWAGGAHKEAVRLFANTVNKLHQIKLLVSNANALRTAATTRLYTKAQAAAYTETVRKNVWVLNNRFAYDGSAGGFYRVGDKRKGAIAQLTSHAAAANVKGGDPEMRPAKTVNERQPYLTYRKRPRRMEENAPTERQQSRR